MTTYYNKKTMYPVQNMQTNNYHYTTSYAPCAPYSPYSPYSSNSVNSMNSSASSEDYSNSYHSTMATSHMSAMSTYDSSFKPSTGKFTPGGLFIPSEHYGIITQEHQKLMYEREQLEIEKRRFEEQKKLEVEKQILEKARKELEKEKAKFKVEQLILNDRKQFNDKTISLLHKQSMLIQNDSEPGAVDFVHNTIDSASNTIVSSASGASSTYEEMQTNKTIKPYKPCKHGNKCINSSCNYIHPSDWIRPPIDNPSNKNYLMYLAQMGDVDKLNLISHKHYISYAMKTNCVYSSNCKNLKCKFIHPDNRILVVETTQHHQTNDDDFN